MLFRILHVLLVTTLATFALTACGDDGGTPTPTATPVSEWSTYDDPEGRFSISYPPGWTEIGGAFYSYDPSERDQLGKDGLPTNTVKVEVGYSVALGSSACGSMTLDPSTGEVASPDPEAVETTLGGEQAWRINRVSAADDSTQIMAVTAVYGGSCASIVWYDAYESPDAATFQQMVDSFEFGADVVPAEWPVYTTADGRLSVRYPPDWFTDDEVIYSFDPVGANGDDGARVELSAREAAGLSNCGRALTLTSDGRVNAIDPAAVLGMLGGEDAWTVTDGSPGERLYFEETSLLRDGYCVTFAGYFPGDTLGYWAFQQMYHSLEITF